MRYLAFRAFFTALIKVEFRRMLTVKLEINTLFTPKATFSSDIDDTRSLLPSEFMISFVP